LLYSSVVCVADWIFEHSVLTINDVMFQDDVKLMADTNLEAYRFSISWSRLIPSMTFHGSLFTIGVHCFML
jgi:hypothetical protein